MSKARVINARRIRIRADLFDKKKVMSFLKATQQFIKKTMVPQNLPNSDFDLGYNQSNDALLALETPMPWGYPESDWPAANTGQLEPVTINESHTARQAQTHFPVCAPQSVQNQQASNSQADLEALLYSLDESGLRVSELKALPSGAMRITVDDLFGNQVREPEFVRVGG
jgi:hypothetical protein